MSMGLSVDLYASKTTKFSVAMLGPPLVALQYVDLSTLFHVMFLNNGPHGTGNTMECNCTYL